MPSTRLQLRSSVPSMAATVNAIQAANANATANAIQAATANATANAIQAATANRENIDPNTSNANSATDVNVTDEKKSNNDDDSIVTNAQMAVLNEYPDEVNDIVDGKDEDNDSDYEDDLFQPSSDNTVALVHKKKKYKQVESIRPLTKEYHDRVNSKILDMEDDAWAGTVQTDMDKVIMPACSTLHICDYSTLSPCERKNIISEFIKLLQGGKGMKPFQIYSGDNDHQKKLTRGIDQYENPIGGHPTGVVIQFACGEPMLWGMEGAFIRVGESIECTKCKCPVEISRRYSSSFLARHIATCKGPAGDTCEVCQSEWSIIGKKFVGTSGAARSNRDGHSRGCQQSQKGFTELWPLVLMYFDLFPERLALVAQGSIAITKRGHALKDLKEANLRLDNKYTTTQLNKLNKEKQHKCFAMYNFIVHRVGQNQTSNTTPLHDCEMRRTMIAFGYTKELFFYDNDVARARKKAGK